MNYQFRKIIKNRSQFHNDATAINLLGVAIHEVEDKVPMSEGHLVARHIIDPAKFHRQLQQPLLRPRAILIPCRAQ